MNMDFVQNQIDFHTAMVQLHTSQIKYLQTLNEKNNHVPEVTKHEILKQELTNIDKTEIAPTEFLDAGQELIWDRIRKARLNQSNATDLTQKTPINQPNEIVPDMELIQTAVTAKKNNLNVDINIPTTDQLPAAPQLPKPLSINKLHKFTVKKRDEIIRNVFKSARSNVERLATIDPTMRDTMDEHIQIEADRLLSVYLNQTVVQN